MTVVPANPETLSVAGQVAALSYRLDAGDPRLLEARRRLTELQLESHIRKAVDAAPPLSDEQRTRLAELLAPLRGVS